MTEFTHARVYATRMVSEQPRHNTETLFNLLAKLYPELTDDEIYAAIKEALNQ